MSNTIKTKREPLDAVSNGRGKVSIHGPRRTYAPLDAIGGKSGKASVSTSWAGKSLSVDPWDKVSSTRLARAARVPSHARTAREWAAIHKIGENGARRELKELKESGVLDSEMVIRDGHLERVYWPK